MGSVEDAVPAELLPPGTRAALSHHHRRAASREVRHLALDDQARARSRCLVQRPKASCSIAMVSSSSSSS